METAALSALTHWANFYVIVGSSAGALTGLQFVVITLIADAQASRSMREIRAFGTPTVVHFCAALMISVAMSAPWQALVHLAACFGVMGGLGLVYSIMVITHARKQTGYTPDAEDWFWYTAAPLVTYAALASASVLLRWKADLSFYLIAASSLVFLFVGIHNAWDTVTFVAIKRSQKAEQ